MKCKLLCLIVCIWIIGCCTSCSGNFDHATLSGNSTTEACVTNQDAESYPHMSDTNPSHRAETLPQEKKEAEQAWLENQISHLVSLQQSGKLRAVYLDDVYSSDPPIITGWVDLLSDMKFSAVPFDLKLGETLTVLWFVTDTGEEFGFGSGFTIPYVYLPMGHEDSIRFQIDNYDELRPRLLELEKAMGLPSSE